MPDGHRLGMRMFASIAQEWQMRALCHTRVFSKIHHAVFAHRLLILIGDSVQVVLCDKATKI